MIRKRNAKAAIFLLITVCFLLMISGCTSAPSHFSGENEENELNEVNGSTDIANGEDDTSFLLPDKELLDEMRREVLGISEDEEIDYALFKSVRKIIIENKKGKTEYIQELYYQAPISFHIKDISYLILFENVYNIQIFDIPVIIVPDLSALDQVNRIFFSRCEIQSIEGLKNMKNLQFLSIYNEKDAVHLEDLYKISNLGNLEELYISGAILNDDDIAFLATDCPVSSSLHRIMLEGNSITTLTYFFNLQKVWQLNCDSNKIKIPYIDPDCRIANTLHTISLRSNGINSLEGLSHLRNLGSLGVSENSIRKFDIVGTSIFDTLKYLNIDGNKLESLDGIVDLNNLRYLDLTENPSVKNFNQLAEAKFLDKLEELYLDEDAVIDIELLNRLPVQYSYPEEYSD